MFSFNKTVVCVEFSKTAVFCALAQISGRKVDIIAIDSVHINSGIIEEGVIYDPPHLQEVVKNLITSVSKAYNKIDAAWIAIPDNKVLITRFDVLKDKRGLDEANLHQTIEEKFGMPTSQLYLINRPIHQLNNKLFFLSDGIQSENLDPFVDLFAPLNIPVEAVLPTFQCIFEETKHYFTAPTLLLYPANNGFKFLLADVDGVYLESVWGHNFIEFDENFDKAINEVLQYAKQSRDIALSVRKIVIVESPNLDSELVQSYVQKTGLQSSWIATPAQDDNRFDPVSILILKGMIKAAMGKEYAKGFLEPQMVQTPTPTRKTLPFYSQQNMVLEREDSVPATNVARRTEPTEEGGGWNWKMLILSLLVGIVLLGVFGFIGSNIAKKVQEGRSSTSPTISSASTPTPTITLTATPTIQPSVTETITPTPTAVVKVTPAKKDFLVQVLNGNNVGGEASRVTGILKSNGYTTKAPQNAATKNIQTTTVSYKNPTAKAYADDIAKIIEPSYPSAKSVLDPTIKDEIIVVLGAK